MPAPPEFVERLVQQYFRKLLRYCGVSVFNLLFGQSLLFFFHSILDWPGWIANVTAVMISAVPAYLLSRHWVWGQRGSHSFKSEVLPFWSMALLGLIISTVAVAIVDDRYDGALPVQLASVASFGVVWVLKFFVLDRLMWKQAHHAPAVATTEPA
ncbi:MAG: GtrA family protein [Acidimicrobiales bacterium]